MGYGSGKLDVTHTFTAYLLLGDLYTALIADLAFVADALVLTAETFPVLCGTEDAFAVETVALCFESTVVDRFGLHYFAVRPASDHFRRRQTYFNRIKYIAFHQQYSFFNLYKISGA